MEEEIHFFLVGILGTFNFMPQLDIMHIEKNVCDSLLGNLLNTSGKTKDGIGTRLDLMEMGVLKELAPKIGEKRTYLPPAFYIDQRGKTCNVPMFI